MGRHYGIFDSFTSERYAGNPAAVVYDTEGLEEAEMQAIAAEFNLSETTFVLPPQNPGSTVRFRWFTPTTEVSMCGHATVAGVVGLVGSGRWNRADVAAAPPIIDTLSGPLTAFVEGVPGKPDDLMIWLDMPKPQFVEQSIDREKLADMLDLPLDAIDPSVPIVRTQDQDLIVLVKDFIALNDAKPDFGRLARWQTGEGMRGLSLATATTLSSLINLQSRFFAPAAGINEDPVTGSVHGPLAVYAVTHGLVPVEDDLAGLQCIQSKAGGRAGVVYALVQRQGDGSHEVRIGGQAVEVMSGTLVS